MSSRGRELLVVFVVLWNPAENLRCYECGIDGRNACTIPFEATMTHTKECRPGVAMCFSIREFGIHYQSRGCSMFVARDGCSFVFAPRRHGIVCNCHDKDLCNCSPHFLGRKSFAVLTFVVCVGVAVVAILV